MFDSWSTRLRSLDRSVQLQLANAGLFALTIDGGIHTVILNLYMLRLGFGPALIGQVNFVGQLVFALASLPAGRLGERWNLKRTMLLGVLLSMLGTAMMPISDLLDPTLRLPWMMAANVLLMIGLAGYYANTAPYVMALTRADSRTSVFSIQAAIYASFGFVGSLVGGYLPLLVAAWTGASLESAFPYRVTLWFAPLFLLVSLFLVQRMRSISLTEDVNSSQQRPATPGAPTFVTGAISLIVLMSVVRFLQVAGVGTATTFFNVYLDDSLHVPSDRIGLIMAISKLFGVPAALAVPYLTRRFGNAGIAIGASLFVVAAIMPIAFVPVWWIAGLGYIVLWGVTPARYSAFLVYIMERCPPHLRGSMNGAGEMAAGLSFAMISLIGGYMIGVFGYSMLFVTGAAITLMGTLLLWGYVVWGNNTTEEAIRQTKK